MTSEELKIEIDKIQAREAAGELISARDGYRLIAYRHEYVQAVRQELRDKQVAEGKDPEPRGFLAPNPVLLTTQEVKE